MKRILMMAVVAVSLILGTSAVYAQNALSCKKAACTQQCDKSKKECKKDGKACCKDAKPCKKDGKACCKDKKACKKDGKACQKGAKACCKDAKKAGKK